MYLKSFIFYCLIVLLAGCSSNSQENNNTGTAADMHNSSNSLDWTGVYSGVLPCADCDGQFTMVKLSKDLTYSFETTYIGKSDKIFRSIGKFSWNQKQNAIILDDKNNTQFLVQENSLIQTDPSGKRINGVHAAQYILNKDVSGITEKYWKLIEINKTPLKLSESNNREPHLVLKMQNNMIEGSGGCNRFTGNYSILNNKEIQFHKIVSTEMGCDLLELENSFFQVLQSSAIYFVNSDTLKLYNHKKENIAIFFGID